MAGQKPAYRLTAELLVAVITLVSAVAWFVLMIKAVTDDHWPEAIFWLLLIVSTNQYQESRRRKS
jgi:hypothetical protein